MNSPFRTETWRIVRYILISLALNVGFALIRQPLVNNVILSSDQPGWLLTYFSYGQILLNTLIACLIHRYFTFRSSKKWFVALLMMLGFALAMQFLSSFAMRMASRFGMEAMITASNMLSLAELILAYLFQRYVLYRDSIDTGAWYVRFHSDNNTEGAYPYE